MDFIKVLAYILITVGILQWFQPTVKYDDLSLKKCWQSNWTIHGWWPDHNKTSWPQFCDPRRYSEFNVTYLEEKLGDRLRQWWSPCPEWKQPAEHFWQHEWEKHGTCTNNTPLEYFGRTLNIFQKARAKKWYGCCGKYEAGQCLLHFNKTTDQWLGVC